MSWIADAAQLASTVFAAAAAGAAWASVRHGQRVWQAAVQPDLVVSVRRDRGLNQPNLVIRNGGQGTAKAAEYVIVTAEERADGFVDVGFIEPGETVLIATSLQWDEHERGGRALVIYRTADDCWWAVANDGGTKRLAKAGRGAPSREAACERMFSNVQWGDLRPGAGQVYRGEEAKLLLKHL